MNLVRQIKLVKIIMSIEKTDQIIIDGNNGYTLSYVRYGELFILNLNRYRYREKQIIELYNNMLRYRFDADEFSMDNLSCIIQDYDNLDINQFILTYGKDPFKWRDYLYPKIILEIFENHESR